MAGGNIKGITIEFNGETTKLDKALRKINQESKSIDQQLKEVNRSLRFNPRNTELLKQKFTLLGQKIDQTDKQLDQFRNAQKQLQAQGVSKQSAEWMKVRRSIIEAESKLKHYKAELRAVKYANITAMGNSFKNAGAGMRTAGMYATIGGASMVMAGKKLLDLNSQQTQAENKLIEIYKTRMGVNEDVARSTMEVAAALQKQGVIGDEVTLSGAQQLATFAKMPSTVDKLLPAMDNLLVQQKGYNATADDAKNIANLFGKAMQGQTGALKRVGISFTDAQAEILKYGTEEERAAVLAEVVTDNVGNMNEAFAETDEGKLQQIKNTMGDIGERLGHLLLPALASVADWLNAKVVPAVEKVVQFMEGHPVIAKIAVAITGLLVVGGPLLIFIGALVSAVGSIMTLLPALSGAFAALTGPIGLVIAAIAAAIAIGIALYKNWDKIKAKALEIKDQVVQAWANLKAKVLHNVMMLRTQMINTWNNIKSKVMSVANTIKNGVVNAFNSIKARASAIFNAVKTAITHPIRTALSIIRGIIEKIKSAFNFSVSLPHIKLPHFSIDPPGWKLGDLLKGVKPSLGISWYAKGGVFNQPTIAGIGEAGPEAVVPLNKFWDKLDSLSTGDTNIVINITDTNGMDKKQLALEIEKVLVKSVKRKRAAWA